LYIPEVKEAGHGIVPTASTASQLALGDALAIASMKYKKFGKLDFKKFHPSGSLGAKLKTVGDLMLTGKKIPFIDEDKKMNSAINIMSSKMLGILIVRNKKNLTVGIVTDGDLKRALQKNKDIRNLAVKDVMTKKPLSINHNELAAKALNLMSEKRKITSLCVHDEKNKFKTIGVIHIHNILLANVQ